MDFQKYLLGCANFRKSFYSDSEKKIIMCYSLMENTIEYLDGKSVHHLSSKTMSRNEKKIIL